MGILRQRADPNAVDDVGLAPLHIAARLYYQDAHKTSNPRYHAHEKIRAQEWKRRRIRTLQLLLNAKADANLQSQSGQTPLHRSIRAPHLTDEAAVNLLIKFKASPYVTDKAGRLPIHLAYSKENGELVN